jgi:cytochrome b6-f complex iron-sulfur subunit
VRRLGVTGIRIDRRSLFRAGFLGAIGLAAGELTTALAPFLRINKIEGLGKAIPVGTKQAILQQFAAANDRPILFREGRFFLLHAPGGIIAAYRKCTHLGCAVPWNEAEDRFHCPCHGSIYDKRTAIVIRDPAPKPLQLFRIAEAADGNLIVDTNPFRALDRPDNRWDPTVLEVRE